mmetsp:Transcript_105157/g.186961  ORF Transcript_105157/g.186961 Transcript_105157/m.186961 type:complete len:90 (+) Transcript_105157:2104-2373(+)
MRAKMQRQKAWRIQQLLLRSVEVESMPNRDIKADITYPHKAAMSLTARTRTLDMSDATTSKLKAFIWHTNRLAKMPDFSFAAEHMPRHR